MSYDFELERIIGEIKRRRARKALIQLPEGLRGEGLRICAEIEARTGAIAYISGDSCYGACDLPLDEADLLRADLVLHFGHSPYLEIDDGRVVYIDVKATADLTPALERAVGLLAPYHTIGLISTVQHTHNLEKAKGFLEARGKVAKIAPAQRRMKKAGQVLGCDYSSVKALREEVEAFLFIGGGNFHPLGAAAAAEKPLIAADPYTGEARDMTELASRLMKRRRGQMAKAWHAERFGIIVGGKIGQSNPRLAETLKKRLEAHGKVVQLLCVREVTAEALENLPGLDAYVNTACPRIGWDDPQRYPKPILTVEEAAEMLDGLERRES